MDIKANFKRFWLWRHNNIWGWVESAGLSLLTLLVCHLVNPSNPLFVRGIFPWPWIASIIIVFQYGFGPGLVSVGFISIMAVTQRDAGLISMHDFQSYILSGVTLVLICALFSSSWIRRMINAEALHAYTEERLASLSRSYYMLRVSSDYLEQNIITKPITLRMALEELQKINLSETNTLSYEVAYSFLQILAQFCSVNTLGIYVNVNNKINVLPYAEIGNMGQLLLHDPLVKECLAAQEICYASINQVEDASDCNYLIAMPLITSAGQHLGVLVIKEMPFWSLSDELLRTLSILVLYFSNNVVIQEDIATFLRNYPDCSVDFVKQLTQLLPLKRDMDIDSAFVAIVVSKELRQYNVIYNLKNQHRLLDSCWSLEGENDDILITLMPFTDAAGIHGYLARINHFLGDELGLSQALKTGQIQSRSLQLFGNNPLSMMRYFLNFIGEKEIA